MITFSQNGDFRKLTSFLEKAKGIVKLSNLDKYGREGVEALSSATPLESGKTADSWYYKVERTRSGAKIIFCNSNINDGVPIAIILQYGHGTRDGAWVEGIDYINPAIQPIFNRIVENMWKEMISNG